MTPGPVSVYRIVLANVIVAALTVWASMSHGLSPGVFSLALSATMLLWASRYWRERAIRAERELARNISAASAQREQARRTAP